MLRDFQYGFRQLRKNKFFSAVVISLLALGIGANTLIFSFINALLLKPLPVRNPDNLFLLEENYEQQVRPETQFGYREFEQILRRRDLFSSAIAEQTWSDADLVPLGEAGNVRLVMTQIVSPNYFSELGIRAYRGRMLTDSDANAASKIPIVLSYQFWESQFNRDPGVIGRVIRLKKYPFVIVGVSPQEFHSTDIERAPDVRLPISAARVLTGQSVYDLDEYTIASGFGIFVRLAPGISSMQAATAILSEMRKADEWEARQSNPHRQRPWPKEQLERFVQTIRSERTTFTPVGRGISQLRDQFSSALKLLMGAVGLLFLGVCANVAGLLLARSEERRREITVRRSIGANPTRILRQLVSENLLLAVPGVLLGIALIYAASPLLLRLLPEVRGFSEYLRPSILTVSPDLEVLLFAAALGALSAIVSGTLPARQGARLDLSLELKGNVRTATKAVPGIGSVAIQVALSVLLLASAGLMLRTFWNLEHLNPGFDRAHIAGFTIDPESAGYSDSRAAPFFRELQERVATLPGVRAVAYGGRGLMRGIGMKSTVAPQGFVLPRRTFLNTSFNEVSPSYFETLGIPLLSGRTLQPDDLTRKPTPVVVNRAFVDLLFPHQNPLGKFLVQGVDGTKPPTAQIVGVVATAKYRSMREQDPPTYYGLFDEKRSQPVVMYVRTFDSPSTIIESVRKLVNKLDPTFPSLEAETIEREVQRSLWQERLVALLSAFFGIAALSLAAIGLYGALAYSVARRRRELGIRIAVGAQVRHIIQTVCGRIMLSVLLGLAAGLVASSLVLGVTRRLLYGIEPLDASALIAAIFTVLVCAAVASAIPSHRAARIDPSAALRHD